MATFLEGIESILLACSLVVVLPALLIVTTAPSRRPWFAAGSIVGTATMMWARAGRLWDVDPGGGARIPMALVIALGFGLAFLAGRPAPVVGVGLGAMTGAVAGWLWQPCVGSRFADILNQAETDRLGSLLSMHVYVAGLLLPVVLLAALGPAFPATRPFTHHRMVRLTALGLGGVYALAVATGWYDDLVSELFRISSG